MVRYLSRESGARSAGFHVDTRELRVEKRKRERKRERELMSVAVF